MNPQFDKASNLNLPPPMPEAAPMPSMQPEQAVSAPEMPVAKPERQAQPAIPTPAAVQPVVPQQQQGTMADNDATSTTNVAATTPAMADDGDLIEKEWVVKAKEIVEKTKNDPYRQSKDMTNFRADYMQKRYNKTIKIAE